MASCAENRAEFSIILMQTGRRYYMKRNDSGYEKDRQQTEAQNVEDYYSGTDIEKMEEIARQVPLSRLERPKWDLDTMKKTGFLDVFVMKMSGKRSGRKKRSLTIVLLRSFF